MRKISNTMENTNYCRKLICIIELYLNQDDIVYKESYKTIMGWNNIFWNRRLINTNIMNEKVHKETPNNIYSSIILKIKIFIFHSIFGNGKHAKQHKPYFCILKVYIY